MFGLIYFGIAGTGSIVEIKENGVILPLVKGTFDFAGVEGTYETPYIGCINSDFAIINNDGDGDLTLCNEIHSGFDQLKLYSKNQQTGANAYGGENYIEAKIRLPAGKVTVNYAYDITDYYGAQAKVVLTMGNEVQTFATKRFSTTERGGSISGIETYTFNLDNEKDLTFRIETSAPDKRTSAEGTLIIEFTPNQVQHDVTPNNNDGQIKPVQLNFIDRINAWIQNFFNKIFGGSK